MSKVENLIFSNGERSPMLMDDMGMPDFWTTLFIQNVTRQVKERFDAEGITILFS
ncbi:MAG: hypothetical protein AB1Z51_13030 [Desulfuromonadales bacterium]